MSQQSLLIWLLLLLIMVELDNDARHVVSADTITRVQVHGAVLLHHHLHDSGETLVLALIDGSLHLLIFCLLHG